MTRYTIKVRSIDVDKVYRDPFQDSAGRWVVYPDEFVVFDSTQKNAGGEPCVWVNNPVWELDDPTGVLDPACPAERPVPAAHRRRSRRAR